MSAKPKKAAATAVEETAVAVESGQAGDQEACPKQVQFDVGKQLGIPELEGIPMLGWDRPWNLPTIKSPVRKPDFVWDPDLARMFVLFWYSGDQTKAMKLMGHTGAGKTEGVQQWHAAFNLPLLFIAANPKTEADQLIGTMVPTGNGFDFVDGPLVTAARMGLSLLIDEYNLIDPGEAGGLNAFLEGKPYTIPATLETILPSRDMRIFATQNPKTAGYKGRNTQDMANDERFVVQRVHYLKKSQELPFVEKLLASLYARMPNKADPAWLNRRSEQLVDVANAIRNQYMGENDSAASLPCTMSTRVLERWATWSVAASSEKLRIPTPLHYALEKVLSNNQSPEVKEALHTIVTTITGEVRQEPVEPSSS